MRRKIPVTLLGETSSLGRHLCTSLEAHPWFTLNTEPFNPESDPHETPFIVDCNLDPDPDTTRRLLSKGHLLLRPYSGKEDQLLHSTLFTQETAFTPHRLLRSQPLAVPDAPVAVITRFLTPLHSLRNVAALDVVVLHPVELTSIKSLDILSATRCSPTPDRWIQQLHALKHTCVHQENIRLVHVPARKSLLLLVTVTFDKPVSAQKISTAWKDHRSWVDKLKLPSRGGEDFHVYDSPPPRELQETDLLRITHLESTAEKQVRFTVTANSTVCGPAGGLLRLAELLVRLGHIYW